MFTMAVGQSDEVDPADAIAAAIDACRAALGDLRPQAGILFSAFDSFDPSVATALREAFPEATVMGSTSAAEISSVGGYQEDSITLAHVRLGRRRRDGRDRDGSQPDVDAACRTAVGAGPGRHGPEPKVCVVLAEGFGVDPQATLDAVARALPDGVVIVGGTSAGRDFSAVAAVLPVLRRRRRRRWRGGPAVLGRPRQLDGGRHRLADARCDRDGDALRHRRRPRDRRTSRRSSSWPATST